jgi:hypothetical protein
MRVTLHEVQDTIFAIKEQLAWINYSFTYSKAIPLLPSIDAIPLIVMTFPNENKKVKTFSFWFFLFFCFVFCFFVFFVLFCLEMANFAYNSDSKRSQVQDGTFIIYFFPAFV